MKTLRSVDKYGCKSSIFAISLLHKKLTEYISADFFGLVIRLNGHIIYDSLEFCPTAVVET